MPSNQDETAVMAAIAAAIPLYLEQAARAADGAARWRIAGRLAQLKCHAIQPARCSTGKWRATAERRVAPSRTLGWD